MRFRRNTFWFYELFFTMILVDCVAVVTVILAPQSLLPMSLTAVLLTVCLLPLIFIEGSSYILVDDTGIKCIKRNQINWSYDWDEIKELRKCSVYRKTGLRITLKVEPKINLQTVQNNPTLDFQLSPAAKKALRVFCPFYK